MRLFKSKRFILGSALFLFVTHLALGLHEIFSAAQTYDEAVHIASGYSFWKTGKFRIDAVRNTPLPNLIATLPLLAANPDAMLDHPSYRQQNDFVYANEFLYENRIPPERILHVTRTFFFLFLAPLLAWLVFNWGKELGGDETGLVALFFYALNPLLLANAPLGASDFCAAVFTFLCLYSFYRTVKLNIYSPWRFLCTGVFLGFALAARYSSIILLGILPIVYLGYYYFSNHPVRLKIAISNALLIIAGIFVGLILVYGPYQIGLWWEGLYSSFRMGVSGGGRINYLIGESKAGGWWYYFPLAFLIKTPIPLILLTLIGILPLRGIRKETYSDTFFVILPLALWIVGSCLLRVQAGIRYILPVYPLCCVVASITFIEFWQSKTVWKRWVLGFLAGWYAWGTLMIHPHYLAYFNETIGIPKEAYRYLVDSNLDWGQELKSLGDFLKREGNPPLYLSYFGTADPHLYGIHYIPVAYFCEFPRLGDDAEPYRSDKIFFAVSATNLASAYYTDKNLMKWLSAYKPYKILGNSIFIYDLTHKPEALEQVARILAMTGDRERSKSLLQYLTQQNRTAASKKGSSTDQDHRFAAFIQEYTVPASWVIISEPMSPNFDAQWRKYTKRRYQALSNFLKRAPTEEALAEFSKSLQFYIQHGIPIYVLSDLVEENSHPSPLLDLSGITLKDIHRCFGPGYAGSIASFDQNRRLYLFLPQDRLEPLFCVFAYNFLIADEPSQIQRTGEILEKIASTMSPSQRRKTAALLKESKFGAQLAFDSLAPSISIENRRKGLQTFQDYLNTNSSNLQSRFKKLDRCLQAD